jgi:anti-sigma regulatory factor (Ser/Thr protein kinase)
MEIAFSQAVPVIDASSVGEVRRTALSVAQRLGFDETRSGELALLTTEASRNVLLHGGGGHVVLSGTIEGGRPVARILAMDQGNGIPNVPQAMEDGYSTGGTMGGGLGAMKRIATVFEIFTGRSGTVVMIELGEPSRAHKLEIAGIAVPFPGEQICGDAWSSCSQPDRTLLTLVDGIGHGWEAAEAAREAIATFQRRAELAPGQILKYMDEALRKTRGAVAAVVEIKPANQTLTYAGVGNISGSLFSKDASQSFVSHNGTLGGRASKIQEFHSEWPRDAVLVLHSDGLQSRWDLGSYAGLTARHPAIIGGTLLRDFRRQRDDASVVVAKAL